MTRKKQKKLKWTAPWPWSPRTRHLQIGRTFDVYIRPEMSGGLFVKINKVAFNQTFRTLPEAKKFAENKIVEQLKYAWKQVMQ